MTPSKSFPIEGFQHLPCCIPAARNVNLFATLPLFRFQPCAESNREFFPADYIFLPADYQLTSAFLAVS
jgi:hypothetical protein